jgi:hypothetical protein
MAADLAHVMAGLVPAIHAVTIHAVTVALVVMAGVWCIAYEPSPGACPTAWIPGTSPGMT